MVPACDQVLSCGTLSTRINRACSMGWWLDVMTVTLDLA
jgi:hypothetical protein